MNMINTRFENRFVRREVAVAVALVIASFGTMDLLAAESDSNDPLPVLVDPAGIIDPELLSTLNALFDNTDGALGQELEQVVEKLSEQPAGAIADVELSNEPQLAAAEPIVASTSMEDESVDASPTIIDPTGLLQDNALPAGSDITQTSEAVSAIEDRIGLKVGEFELTEKTEELGNGHEGGSLIDPHLPPPVLPEIVLTDVPLPTLRFTDLLALALVDNPGVVMAEERVLQAMEQANQVGAFRYPSIAVTSTLGPEYNDPVASEESGVATTIGKNVKLTLTHQLYDGGAARSNFQRSSRLIGAAEAESQIELESLLLSIVINYVDYWRFQIELVQAEKFVSVMNDLVDDLNSMFKAGATSKLEVDFARARVASARGAESEANAAMNNAFSELEYLVPGLGHFSANSPEKFSDFILLSLQDYLDKGARSNSGFITNRMNTEATELKVRAAKGLFKPTVNVELSGSYIDDEGQPSEPRMKAAAKFLFNYTFYNGGERRAGVRRAESQLRELRAERISLEREVFREIDQSFNNITASRLALDAVNDEIIAHEELQRLNRQNLALGTVNIMELIDVEERLFNASKRKNEVLATMYQEYFTLQVSAGFTEEILAKYELELATRQAD